MDDIRDELLQILVDWENAESDGRRVPVEEVCPDREELWPELKQLKAGLREIDDIMTTREPGQQSSSGLTITVSEETENRPDIPGFEIYEELGRGGMGIVYRARQIELNRIVAVKMILAGANVKRFRKEAEAMARLNHPGLVQVFEVGTSNGRAYFAMEYVEGGNLAHALRSGEFSETEAASIIEQLAGAVDAAHKLGIVHRDLKPSNVLTDSKGGIHVSDFGLAKFLDLEASLTHSGDILGTPSYMAPEQIEARLDEIGPATDVFAAGVILYQLLTGRLPFGADSNRAIMARVLNSAPEPPGRHCPVSNALETICLKCLEKQPGDRYGSMRELADDIARWRSDLPIRARRISKIQRLRRFVSRPTGIISLFSFVALIVLAVVLLTRGAAENSDDPLAPEIDAQQRFAQFQKIKSEVFRTLPENYRVQADASRIIRLSESAFQLFHVLDSADWDTRAPATSLSEDKLELLRSDVAALISLFLDIQQNNGIRGAAFSGLGFEIRKDAGNASARLARIFEVSGGGVAENAGLATDDKVLAINGLGGFGFKNNDDFFARALEKRNLVELKKHSSNKRGAENLVIKRDLEDKRGLGFTFTLVDQLTMGEIEEGGAAWRSGLRPGDVVLSINGQPAEGPLRVDLKARKIHTFPFTGAYEALATSMKKSARIEVYDRRSKVVKAIVVDWSAAKTERIRRCVLLHAVNYVRSEWGSFELAKLTPGSSFAKIRGIGDPEERTAVAAERYFTSRNADLPGDLLRAAVRKVLAVYPAYVQACELRAEGLVKRDFSALNRAEAALRKSIQRYPADAMSYRLIARFHSASGRHKEAVAALNQYLQLRPGTHHEYLMRGRSLFALNKHTEAERDVVAGLRDIDAGEKLGILTNVAKVRLPLEALLKQIRSAKSSGQ